MQELFLTALNEILGEHVEHHLRVLQGYCGMQPVHKYERQLSFEGPNQQAIPIPAQMIKSKRPHEQPNWLMLNKQLTTMSYYIKIGYGADVDEVEGREVPGQTKQ